MGSLKIAGLAALTAAALAGTMALAGPASADPNHQYGWGGYNTGDYAGAGSDTIQDVINRLANEISSSAATGGKTIESWDAINPDTGLTYDTIATKGDSSNTLSRPNGSGDGVQALRASLGLSNTWSHGTVAPGSLDFARSSSGPSDFSTTELTWIPFAIDAVDYAVKRNGPISTTLSSTDVSNIYKCQYGPNGDNTITVGGTNYTIQPYVPQPGSGTRKFFESKVGIADSAVNTTCVKDHKIDTGALIEEHDGRVLTNPTVGGVHYAEVTPFSIAQYLAQGKASQTGVVNRRGQAVLGTLDGQVPYTNGKLNTSFPWTRSVYLVVPTNKINGNHADKALQSLFKGKQSALCKDRSTIALYGFGQNTSCGAITLKAKQ